MSVNPLSNSGIESLISQYQAVENNRSISPLETRKAKFSTLASAWGDLSSKLDSFKTILSDLKVSTSSSIFNSKKAVLSSSDFFKVTTEKTANAGNYAIRVNQLAKSDLLVSESKSFTADTYDITDKAGTHQIKVNSGDYTSYVDVTFDDSENNQTLMQKISTAINTDKAVVKSTTTNQGNTFTGTGEFKVNLNGTETTISYDYNNMSYSDIAADLKTKIGDISGISTEVDGGTGLLKMTVDDSSKYISINKDADNALLNFMGVSVEKEKAASAISTGSVFSPSTGMTKLSITADNTGYDNRLILQDITGSALASVGLTSDVLSNRTVISGDNDAGFVYSSTSATNNQLNAKLNFNGINVQRNTNSITDIVDGVTFALSATMGETVKTVDVTVSADDSTIKTKLQDFIKSFNSIYTTLKAKSSADLYGRGVFASDSTAQSLLRTLTTTAMGKVNGVTDSLYSRLSGVGITFDPTTGLTLADETKLTNAINDHGESISQLFNASDGIATSLYNKVSSYVGSAGVIATVKNAYDNNVKYLSDKITSVQSRIDKSSETLRKKYQEMQEQYTIMINNQNMMNSITSGSMY